MTYWALKGERLQVDLAEGFPIPGPDKVAMRCIGSRRALSQTKGGSMEAVSAVVYH